MVKKYILYISDIIQTYVAGRRVYIKLICNAIFLRYVSKHIGPERLCSSSERDNRDIFLNCQRLNRKEPPRDQTDGVCRISYTF